MLLSIVPVWLAQRLTGDVSAVTTLTVEAASATITERAAAFDAVLTARSLSR